MNDVAGSFDPVNQGPSARRWSPWRWLIAAGVVCLILVVAIPLKFANDCQSVLKAVETAGGEVLIQTVPYDNPFLGGWLFRAKRKLYRHLHPGIRSLDRSQRMTFLLDESATIDDDWLQQQDFSALPCHVSVQIRHPDVTDVGLQALLKIAQLDELVVPRTSLTDGGLKVFSDHPDLTEVYLKETKVTDACLPVLATLPKLRTLTVAFTEISGNELHQLSACPELKYLGVDASQLTEPFLSALSTFPKLNQLTVLSSAFGSVNREQLCVVDDALLQRLLHETTIISLWIEDGSAITDASVSALLKARHLRELDILEVGISPDEVRNVNSIHRSRIGNRPALRVPGQPRIE